jgi:hypothetical protein
VVAENRINRNIEGVFEVGVQLGDCPGVVRHTSFPNSVTDDVSGVVDVVKFLSQFVVFCEIW